MATKKNTSKTETKTTALAKATRTATQGDQLPATIDLTQHAGAGLENTDRDSFAIPFLAIMQKGSPQVDKDSDERVDDAEVGDLLLTTSKEVFKDEDGVDVVFCGYRRVFLRWAPESSGGGFKGEIPVDEVARMRSNGELREEDNRLYAKNGDIVRDTRIHYVLVVRDDGSYVPAVLSVSSTQIKKSKQLLTQIQSFVATDGKGRTFNPPSFGHVFHAETVAESNDKGSWRGWKFERKGFVQDANLYKAAVTFHDQVLGDAVVVNYNDADPAKAGAASSGDDRI